MIETQTIPLLFHHNMTEILNLNQFIKLSFAESAAWSKCKYFISSFPGFDRMLLNYYWATGLSPLLPPVLNPPESKDQGWFIHLGRERHCESTVPCPRTQQREFQLGLEPKQLDHVKYSVSRVNYIPLWAANMFSRHKQLSVHGQGQLENNEEKKIKQFYLKIRLWALDFYRVIVDEGERSSIVTRANSKL